MYNNPVNSNPAAGESFAFKISVLISSRRKSVGDGGFKHFLTLISSLCQPRGLELSYIKSDVIFLNSFVHQFDTVVIKRPVGVGY